VGVFRNLEAISLKTQGWPFLWCKILIEFGLSRPVLTRYVERKPKSVFKHRAISIYLFIYGILTMLSATQNVYNRILR
jgi:hypothetical protein